MNHMYKCIRYKCIRYLSISIQLPNIKFHAILRAAFAYAVVYVVYDVCEKSLAFSEAENWSPISTCLTLLFHSIHFMLV